MTVKLVNIKYHQRIFRIVRLVGFILFCFLADSYAIAGNNGLVIDKDVARIALDEYVDYQIHEDTIPDLEDILGEKTNQPWIRHSADRINFGITDNYYWFRLKIKNNTPLDLEKLVRVGNPLIEEIDFYAFKSQASG